MKHTTLLGVLVILSNTLTASLEQSLGVSSSTPRSIDETIGLLTAKDSALDRDMAKLANHAASTVPQEDVTINQSNGTKKEQATVLDISAAIKDLPKPYAAYLLSYIKALQTFGAHLEPEKYFLKLLTQKRGATLQSILESLLPLAISFRLTPLIKLSFPLVKTPDTYIACYIPQTLGELKLLSEMCAAITLSRKDNKHLHGDKIAKAELEEFVESHAHWYESIDKDRSSDKAKQKEATDSFEIDLRLAVSESAQLYIMLHSQNRAEFIHKLQRYYSYKTLKGAKSDNSIDLEFDFRKDLSIPSNDQLNFDSLILQESFRKLPESMRVYLALYYCKKDTSKFTGLIKGGDLFDKKLSDADEKFITACILADESPVHSLLGLTKGHSESDYSYITDLQRIAHSGQNAETGLNLVNRKLIDIGLTIALQNNNHAFVLKILHDLKPIPEGHESDIRCIHDWAYAYGLIQTALTSENIDIILAVLERNRIVTRQFNTTLEQAIKLRLLVSDNPAVQEALIARVFEEAHDYVSDPTKLPTLSNSQYIRLWNMLKYPANTLKSSFVGIYTKLELKDFLPVQRTFLLDTLCYKGRLDALKEMLTEDTIKLITELERSCLISRALENSHTDIAHYIEGIGMPTTNGI